MIFKVYYQENAKEIPVRERTNALYLEAESEANVREKLQDRGINIEFINRIDGAYLEYEMQSENYKVLEI